MNSSLLIPKQTQTIIEVWRIKFYYFMENGLPIVWIFQTKPNYDGKNIIDNHGHIVQLR